MTERRAVELDIARLPALEFESSTATLGEPAAGAPAQSMKGTTARVATSSLVIHLLSFGSSTASFPSEHLVEAKAVARELPATHGPPLSQVSRAEARDRELHSQRHP